MHVPLVNFVPRIAFSLFEKRWKQYRRDRVNIICIDDVLPGSESDCHPRSVYSDTAAVLFTLMTATSSSPHSRRDGSRLGGGGTQATATLKILRKWLLHARHGKIRLRSAPLAGLMGSWEAFSTSLSELRRNKSQLTTLTYSPSAR
jgi:hypothetical protein